MTLRSNLFVYLAGKRRTTVYNLCFEKRISNLKKNDVYIVDILIIILCSVILRITLYPFPQCISLDLNASS